jgi:hypothetical protein
VSGQYLLLSGPDDEYVDVAARMTGGPADPDVTVRHRAVDHEVLNGIRRLALVAAVELTDLTRTPLT